MLARTARVSCKGNRTLLPHATAEARRPSAGFGVSQTPQTSRLSAIFDRPSPESVYWLSEGRSPLRTGVFVEDTPDFPRTFPVFLCDAYSDCQNVFCQSTQSVSDVSRIMKSQTEELVLMLPLIQNIVEKMNLRLLNTNKYGNTVKLHGVSFEVMKLSFLMIPLKTKCIYSTRIAHKLETFIC